MFRRTRLLAPALIALISVAALAHAAETGVDQTTTQPGTALHKYEGRPCILGVPVEDIEEFLA